MKFKMVHENYNVKDLKASLAFYEKALGLHEVRRKEHPDGDFIIVFPEDAHRPQQGDGSHISKVVVKVPV